jgi:hypothetical protein
VRGAVGNVVLDVRTACRLGKVLWRPLFAVLWSRRKRRLPLAHR